MKTRCDARHDGHNCSTAGACQRALADMLERMNNRTDPATRPERERTDR